jgi:hypothetical protein
VFQTDPQSGHSDQEDAAAEFEAAIKVKMNASLFDEGEVAVGSRSRRLSKSKFIAGLQCHKRLYLEIRQPDLATPADAGTQAVFDEGHAIGRLAHRLFPGGVLVDHDHEHIPEALQQTALLLQDPTVPAIFEAAFNYGGVLVRVDILVREPGNRWRLIEVKASTSVKDPYPHDLAIQTYVVQGAGLSLSNSWLMHVNNRYVHRGGDIDVPTFFASVNLTQEVEARLAALPQQLAEMQTMLARQTPPIQEPDGHCHTPYGCPFWDHCTRDKPADWVFYLPRAGKKFEELRAMGVETIDAIPGEFPLTPHQRLMKEQREWIDAGLKAALNAVEYPVHHLDFETLRLGIPRYVGTRPYQQIPFQWSNHIQAAHGDVAHEDFLHAEAADPRPAFLESLLDSVGTKGSICVYTNFEQRILAELREALPKYARHLDRVIARLWDLHAVIRDAYYHPGFEASYSLKQVLPALLPAMAYEDLAIQDGDTASLAYAQMLFGEMAPAERETIKSNLLAYCGRDTLAMVEIRRVLAEKAAHAESSK